MQAQKIDRSEKRRSKRAIERNSSETVNIHLAIKAMRLIPLLLLLTGCQGITLGIHPDSVVHMQARLLVIEGVEDSASTYDRKDATVIFQPRFIARKRKMAKISTSQENEAAYIVSLRGNLVNGMWVGRVQVKVEGPPPLKPWRGWRELTPEPDGEWALDLGWDAERKQRVLLDIQMEPHPSASPFGFPPGTPLPKQHKLRS